jgi:hypothetical protein
MVRQNAAYSQRANDLYASTVYTHIPHKRIQISEITLLPHVCKAATLPLSNLFWYSKVYTLYLPHKTNNMTVTIKFNLGAIDGPAELFPGTDTFDVSVLHALEHAIDDGDEEALQWLTDNIWKIEII